MFGTASIAGTIVVLALGHGLLAVLTVNLVITLLTAVSFYLKSRTLLPGVSFMPRISRFELRLLLGFGALRAVQRVSTRIVFQLDRLVVGAFAPIAAVAYYAVPLALSQQVTGIVNNVGTAVFPAASALSGQRDERRVEELYLRAMKLAALITLPMASIMFFYAHQIMQYWLSPEFEAKSSSVLMILAVANLLFAATTVPAVTLDATGRIRISTLFGLAAAAANLVLVFTLVPTIGFRGAAWAVLGNAAIMVPILLYYVHTRVLEVSLRDLFERCLARPLLAAAVLWPAMIWARQYATNLALVAGLCFVSLLAYVGLTVIVGAFDARDRSLFRSFIGR
jgi:O-antigen/teichoic acid export membrane protein